MQGTSKVRTIRATVAIAIVILMALILAPSTFAMDTWTVNPVLPDNTGCVSPTFQCKDIQAAVTAAAPGDTINVLAGTYVEQVAINKSLTLTGAGSGPGGSIIDATSLATTGNVVAINTTAGNVTLDGFRILTGQKLNGIYANATSAASTVTITHNYIEGWRTSANPGRVCSIVPGEDNFDLIAGYGSQASLLFQYNQLLQGCSNAILLEKWIGPTDVSYNSWDRGVDDVSTDGYFNMNYGGPDITALHKVSHNTIDLGGGTLFTNAERSAGISFAASYTGVAGGYTNIEITDNVITNLKPYRRGISLWNNSAAPGITGGISNAVVERNTIAGNGAGDTESGGIRLIGKTVNSQVRFNKISNVAFGVRNQAYNGHISAAAGTVLTLNSFEANAQAVDWQGVDTLGATCNWWNAISGPTAGANPGGLGQPYVGTLTFSPWLIYGTDASPDPGLQLPTAFTVTAGGDVSAADNNYRSLGNAVGCVQTGQTINLSGTFNFGAPNAQASWVLGNDGVTGPGYTIDDYEVNVPADANNVTLTAASLGAATIQGPGDVATIDLEGFLQFYNTGTNTGWTISNLRILDFDLGIGMFCCAGGPGDKYTGTTITNNLIRLAKDLKGASASGPEDFQNIGIHLAYGQNQTVSNNTIEIPGDGISDPTTTGQDWWTYGATPGWLYSSQIGLQSNTHGGASYDDLQITGNIVKVLTAQSANPARIIGIWENGHANSSDVTVSTNQFLNMAAGNDSALNRQMAFRATSHSSGSTTVAYSGNTVQGASMAFGPMTVSAGNQPIQMTGNTATNVKTGILLGQYETLHLTNNKLISSLGTGVGVSVPALALVTMDSTPANLVGGFATGVQVDGSATIDNSKLVSNGTGLLVQGTGTATINNSTIANNSAFGVNNTAVALVNATSNFWGSCDGPGPVGPGSGDNVSTNVDFSGFLTAPQAGSLQALIDAAQPGDTIDLGTCAPYQGATVDKPLTINLNGSTIGPGSPGLTISADDVTVNGPGTLDGWNGLVNSTFPGILVNAGSDNFILNGVEIKRWADGVEVAGAHQSLKIVNNWIHLNSSDGIQFNLDLTLSGVVTINGNLLKVNTDYGINNLSAVTVPATYNSWGDVGGPASGDGVNGPVTDTPYTFSEVFVDVTPDTAATVRNVTESVPFNVAVKVDAKGLYAVQYKLTYDPNFLTLQDSDGGIPGVQVADGLFKGSGSCTQNVTVGSVSVYCTRFLPDADASAVETISTLTFIADGVSLVGNGTWTTYLDLSVAGSELSSAARNGIKVFVNNGGFDNPSATPGRTITDSPDDGEIIITGIAKFTGFVDVQGRPNDSGAVVEVYDTSTTGGSPVAGGTSVSSGSYTTDYIGANLLTVGTTYYFQVDRPLYLPTTVKYPSLASTWGQSKLMAIRPLTSLATFVLLGGDATNDDIVDIFDGGCIGPAYGGGPVVCNVTGSSDVNGDGVTNILDLVLFGGNYTLTSSPWTP